jgi:Carboxypeptidase regulatory-like domain
MTRFCGVVLLALMLASFALAQKKEKAPSERSLSGIITDASGAPAPGAVVQLKNLKTLQIRSYIAREKGDYHFNGLSTDVDYEVKADWNGHSSATRTLSSFDSHPEAVINLSLK